MGEIYKVNCWIEHATFDLDQTFLYLSNQYIERGCRIKVPFGTQILTGFVESCEACEKTKEELEKENGFKILYVKKIVDEEPILNDELFHIGLQMAYDTVSPAIACFQTILPGVIKPKTSKLHAINEKWVRVNDKEVELKTAKQVTVYKELNEIGIMKYHDYLERYKSVGKKLIELGCVDCFEKEKEYTEKEIDTGKWNTLSAEQENAVNVIWNTDKMVSLIHGVTGSGKTEIYLHLTRKMIMENKQVLILVPEISLTAQMIDRVKSRFGDHVAIYHSGLNNQEKYEQYQRVKHHKVDIVVGTRSAIFMPFDHIGLIVLDEEHDPSYKQDVVPCYHTIDVAIERCRYHHAKLVLSSATPSFNSYARGIKGIYELVELRERYNSSLPDITLVDMKDNIEKTGDYIISEVLKNKLNETLKQNKQAIILLNRRGYNNVLRCTHCNEALMCPHCDMTLSYHNDIKMMMCHTCGYTMRIPKVCPKCHRETRYSTYGYGTQRVEEELKKLFPEAKVLRMDKDTTSRKNGHHMILEAFGKHEADILLGTQMIAKGLDFPNVTLVGILNGDAGLKHSDYMSCESCFDLLVQASGRSGRQSGGEVVIQVFDTHHYALKYAVAQDYLHFFNEEMKFRHASDYPPYTYLISILISHRNLNKVNDTCTLLCSYLNGNHKVLGPTPLLKIMDENRYQIILKGKNLDEMRKKTIEAIEMVSKKGNLAKIKVNVMPAVL